MMKTLIHNDWQQVLEPEFEKPYYQQLHNFLKSEYQHYQIHQRVREAASQSAARPLLPAPHWLLKTAASRKSRGWLKADLDALT